MNCSICGKEIQPKGTWVWGNNAEPVNDGRCCDECDTFIVIPVRLAPSMGAQKAVQASTSMEDAVRKLKQQQERSPTK